jgi:HSP20 family molecular chaperone IbpA
VSIGDILRQLGELLRTNANDVTINRSGSLPGPSRQDARYDLRLQMKTLAPQNASADSRPTNGTIEPAVDIFDEPDCLVVLAQLPGLTEAEVGFEISGQTLTIKGDSATFHYFRRLLLPFAAEISPHRFSFRNGVLDLRIAKPPSDHRQDAESRGDLEGGAAND